MQDAQTAITEASAGHAPERAYVPLPWRDHTILGVCEAIGEDFGFNPIWLRIVLATGVLMSPTYAIGTYFALGAVVLLSRLIFPKKVAAAAAAPPHLVAEQDVAVPAPQGQTQADKVCLAA